MLMRERFPWLGVIGCLIRRKFWWMQRARNRRWQLTGAVAAFAFAMLMVGIFMVDSTPPPMAVQRRFLQGTWLCIFALCCLGMALRARRDWGALGNPATRLLCLSELGPGGVLLWYSVDTAIDVLVLLAASVPIFAWTGLGIMPDWRLALTGVLVSGSVALWFQATGLLAAALRPGVEGLPAFGGLLALVGFALGAVPGAMAPAGGSLWLALGCPPAAFVMILDRPHFYLPAATGAVLWIGLSLAVLALAGRLYGWQIGRWRGGDSEAAGKKGKVAVRRGLAVPALQGDPCTWAEFDLRGKGWKGQALMAGVALIGMVLIGALLRTGEVGYGTVFGLLAIGLLTICVVSFFSGLEQCIKREWEAQSMDLLLLTDLLDAEIIRGKLLGVAKGSCCFGVLGLLAGAIWLLLQIPTMLNEPWLPLVGLIGVALLVVTLVAMAIVQLVNAVKRTKKQQIESPQTVIWLTVVVLLWIVAVALLWLLDQEDIAAVGSFIMLAGAYLYWLVHAWRLWRRLNTELRLLAAETMEREVAERDRKQRGRGRVNWRWRARK